MRERWPPQWRREVVAKVLSSGVDVRGSPPDPDVVAVGLLVEWASVLDCLVPLLVRICVPKGVAECHRDALVFLI